MSEAAFSDETVPVSAAASSPRQGRAFAWRWTFVALVAALGEGVGAMVSASAAGGGRDAIIWAALEAAAVLAPALLVLAQIGSTLGRLSHTRTFGEALVRAWGGNPGLALLLGAGALAGAGDAAGWIGYRFLGAMSGGFATAATVIVALLLGVALLLVSAYVGAWLAPWLDRYGKRWRLLGSIGSPALIAALLAGVAMTVLALLLSPYYVLSPLAACAAVAFTHADKAMKGIERRLGRIPAWPVVVLLVPLCTLALFHLPKLPIEAQFSVLYRAPYASLVVGGVRSAFDRDRDGYSPILGGGDCNDSDPAIHPGAPDNPDNGTDENCSGQDAHAYQPVLEPREARPAALPPRMNVVLVQMDALRPDHLGFAGYSRPTSPELDRFRSTATWFKRAYTPAPSTRFATPALLTGFDVEQIPQERGPRIDLTVLPTTTVAGRLIPFGYDRVGYTISYLAQHIHGLEQGFRIWKTPWPVEEWKETYPTAATLTTDAALDYLKTVAPDGQSPYLLFLHYQCNHDPYIKHDEWDYGSREIDLYDSALNYCDQELGRLVHTLEGRPDYDRTAVVVYSDHGELFGEHGFIRHGNTLYEPDVRALLLLRLPGNKVATVDDAVTLTDLAPTTLELASVPKDGRILSWSLLRYLYPPGAHRDARPIFLYTDLTRGTVHYEGRGVVDGDYKYIHDLGSGIEELYRLGSDPNERYNLATVEPDRRERMAEMVDSWESYVTTRR